MIWDHSPIIGPGISRRGAPATRGFGPRVHLQANKDNQSPVLINLWFNSKLPGLAARLIGFCEGGRQREIKREAWGKGSLHLSGKIKYNSGNILELKKRMNQHHVLICHERGFMKLMLTDHSGRMKEKAQRESI